MTLTLTEHEDGTYILHFFYPDGKPASEVVSGAEELYQIIQLGAMTYNNRSSLPSIHLN